MSDTYCPIPWIFQAIRNNGDVRICCQANVTKNKGVVRKEDGTSYNASTDSLSQARNAELMKIVRKNMINGEWSEECGRCKSEEENGLISRRSYELSHWGKIYDLEWAKNNTNLDGSINEENIPLVYYDLRFGNLCNLACRMCGPTDSHTWYEQWVEYYKEDGYSDTHGWVKLDRNEKGRLYTNDYSWHENLQFWEQLEKNIPYLSHVYMAGGEPLLIEQHYNFLQKCIDMGYSKNIVIEYNTNMTSLPDKVIRYWEKFKKVRVGASIDGIGSINDYQRWPAKWSSIYKNLQKLDNTSDNIMAWLAVTVTAYNAFHIPEMIKWKYFDSGFKKINPTSNKPLVTHHVAHHPKKLNVRVLTDELKDELESHYESFKSEFKNTMPEHHYNKACHILDGIIKYSKSEDYSKYRKEFWSWTNYLDQKRNQNILDIVPQLERMKDES